MSDDAPLRCGWWASVRPLLVVGVVAVLLGGGLVYYAVQQARALSHKAKCRGYLKQIGTALHNYYDAYGAFPPAYVADADGRPIHSWRVLILPQLGEERLYSDYRFDEPWDGPHNRKLALRMPVVYACPEQAELGRTITNFVAVVGKETIWPEQYAARLADIQDGTSNTIQLLEWPGSDIVWTEPRDVRYRDTEKTLTPPAHGGADDGVQHVLLGDASVRAVSVNIDRTTYRRLQTRSSGRPLPGVVWPVDPGVREFDFGAEVSAEQLVTTNIVPHRDTPIADGRNAVWCATFQMAWDDLRQEFGEPVALAGEPPLAAAMNRESFDRQGLDPGSYVAEGGRVSLGVLDEIERVMSVRFPNVTPSALSPRPGDDAIVIYGFLLKILPFAVHFERLDDSLQFQSAGATTPVTAFGVSEEPGAGFDEAELRQQVSILDYKGPDDFVLQLDTLDRRDVIVLAKVPPAATLAETIATVRGRIDTSMLPVPQRMFELKEILAVPVLNLNVDRQYDEIIGRPFVNAAAQGLQVGRAAQVIRFHLDERGAHLESEVEIMGENGHSEPPPPAEPRKFIFDRPFLLLLQERGATEPYFAAWIANVELMEPQ